MTKASEGLWGRSSRTAPCYLGRFCALLGKFLAALYFDTACYLLKLPFIGTTPLAFQMLPACIQQRAHASKQVAPAPQSSSTCVDPEPLYLKQSALQRGHLLGRPANMGSPHLPEPKVARPWWSGGLAALACTFSFMVSGRHEGLFLRPLSRSLIKPKVRSPEV